MERRLDLPHPLAPGSGAFLEIQVGALAPGQRLRVLSMNGAVIGTVAPFGPAARRAVGTYTIPVSPDLIHDGKLFFTVSLVESSRPARDPTTMELRSVSLQVSDKVP